MIKSNQTNNVMFKRYAQITLFFLHVQKIYGDNSFVTFCPKNKAILLYHYIRQYTCTETTLLYRNVKNIRGIDVGFRGLGFEKHAREHRKLQICSFRRFLEIYNSLPLAIVTVVIMCDFNSNFRHVLNIRNGRYQWI